MPEVLDRRVALEEAFESAEADAKGEEYVPPVREVEEETPELKEPAPIDQDPAEIEAKAADKKDKPRTKGVPLSDRVKPDEVKTEEAPTEEPKTRSLEKAPLGWGPQRDALWAKVPADARAVISRREQEIQNGMSQAGRIRQVAEEYHQVIMPFENVIRSMNTTPREALTNVMQTATALIVGTQAQKCAVITEMVARYGVDLPELDKSLTAMLKNGGKFEVAARMDQQQPLDPRLQSLYALEQRLREAEGQKQERLQGEAVEAINSVQGEKYFEDVRADMADIMEISAKRGHVMSIKQAYDKACQLNPEVSKLMPLPGKTTNSAVARARKAASTVRGSPGGPVNSGKTDRRSQLEAAWDSA